MTDTETTEPETFRDLLARESALIHQLDSALLDLCGSILNAPVPQDSEPSDVPVAPGLYDISQGHIGELESCVATAVQLRNRLG